MKYLNFTRVWCISHLCSCRISWNKQYWNTAQLSLFLWTFKPRSTWEISGKINVLDLNWNESVRTASLQELQSELRSDAIYEELALNIKVASGISASRCTFQFGLLIFIYSSSNPIGFKVWFISDVFLLMYSVYNVKCSVRGLRGILLNCIMLIV